MDLLQALLVSFLLALVVVVLINRFRDRRSMRQVMDTPGDQIEHLEDYHQNFSPADLVARLGMARCQSLLAEPYPDGDVARKTKWWYFRRRIALALTQRPDAVDAVLLRAFYGLQIGGEEAPDDAAQIRQAILSYMLGPAREIFPFDKVPVQPPMPLKLFLLCQDEEETHPVAYPGTWHWMHTSEFAKVQNPNVRLGEHLVMEPVSMAKDSQSARVRFRWGTPPGVYLQDVEVRKVGGLWVVYAIRDTFKLR